VDIGEGSIIAVEDYEIGRFAGCKASQLAVHAKSRRPADGGHVHRFSSGERRCLELVDTLEQDCSLHGLEHVLTVVAGWPVNSDTHRHPELAELVHRAHARSEDHVRHRVMRHADTVVRQCLTVIPVNPHAVGGDGGSFEEAGSGGVGDGCHSVTTANGGHLFTHLLQVDVRALVRFVGPPDAGFVQLVALGTDGSNADAEAAQAAGSRGRRKRLVFRDDCRHGGAADVSGAVGDHAA